MNKCKHTIKYVRFYDCNENPPFLRREYTYSQLSDEDREEADIKYADDSLMRCSEHCGNTVRDK